MQFVAEFVLCLLEFFDRFTHAARQFRQFFGAEQQQNDQQDENPLWPFEYIQEVCEQGHTSIRRSDRLPKLQDNFASWIRGARILLANERRTHGTSLAQD